MRRLVLAVLIAGASCAALAAAAPAARSDARGSENAYRAKARRELRQRIDRLLRELDAVYKKAVALAVTTASCGTILYPERRGQRGGRIDAGVAVLDGVGLLFFIIPGVIAFAVDFGNGTIYLPGGSRRAGGRLRELRFDPSRDPRGQVERVVRAETGAPLRLDDPGLETAAVDSPAELPALFARARADGYAGR